MHAYRLKRYGSPGTAEPKRPRDRYENNGYTMIRVGGALRYEHRIVMEQILGRPLEKYENVHHVNGARNDNRPENLEVWLTSQPAGQRPADVIDWFLDFYPDLVAERQEARNATLK